MSDDQPTPPRKQSKVLTTYLRKNKEALKKLNGPDEQEVKVARKKLDATVSAFLRQVGIPPLDGTEDEHFYPPRRKKR